MAELLSEAPSARDAVDEELLEGFWKASRVSYRLLMFQQVGFLRLLVRPGGRSLMQETMETYDMLFGRPGGAVLSRFKYRRMSRASWRSIRAGQAPSRPSASNALRSRA